MQIKLNGVVGAGKYAIVDPDDYPRLMRHSWYFREGYALSKINNKETRMHRLIMNESNPDIVIDHKNRNRLDNRKSNLRTYTLVENANNREDNVFIECFGESKTIAEWSRDDRCLVSYAVLRSRIYRGIEPWAAILGEA